MSRKLPEVPNRPSKDDEIYGCWSSTTDGRECPRCEGPLIEVPREGHTNSPFWVLEDSDNILIACEAGCTAQEVIADFWASTKKGDEDE